MPLTTIDRRSFLRRSAIGGVGLAIGGSALLAACGSDTKSSASGAGDLKYGDLDYQLAWIKNFEFTGSYFADTNRYYQDEGVGVTLVPAGPTTAIETQVVSKKAFIATSYSEVTAASIKEGAPVIIIGTIYQKSPMAVISLSENPITKPEDLLGKKIGVPAVAEATWNAFLEINDLDAADINRVPVQVDPAPLASKDVEGWLGYVMDESSTLRARGVEVDTMLLADYGYDAFSSVYVVRKDTLKSEREKVKAFMRAEIRGWTDALADPVKGAELTVDVYGKNLGLNAKAQRLAAEKQNEIIVTGPDRGLLTLDPTILAGTVDTLGVAGIDITVDELYDLTLLDEVYDGKTTL
jgi:ABC-type nitrate/sulfonate/bicarbonate transport system substrate-binding protein